MNKIIVDQLQKVSVADLSNFDPNTNTYFIKRKTDIRIEVDSCYLIKLNASLLHPIQNDVLTTNWNAGSVPQYEYYTVDVCKSVGKMIKVVGLAFDYENQKDLNSTWTGWLPLSEIKILEKLDDKKV